MKRGLRASDVCRVEILISGIIPRARPTTHLLIGDTKSLGIPHGRLSKEAPILSIELACAFIADLIRCARRIHFVKEPPRRREGELTTIVIRGGQDVEFSNFTLTLGSRASGHFGTDPLPGVVRKVSREHGW